ncbi:ECF transporter S component [Lactobacillus porci]|uniref:ECF transporter S component n=1 Tax=Lactobacillus porci TaxID=2012477 RepID=UPI003991FAFD
MNNSAKRKQTLNVTITAVFTAILLLEAFIPNIGNITIFPGLPTITIIPLTVAVYACLMGPKAGAGFGLAWGLTSLIRAYAAPNSLVTILLFQNPVICLLPRVLAGYLAGLTVSSFKKWAKTDKGLIAGYTLSGLIASIANTLLVILLSAAFYWNDPGKLLSALGQSGSGKSLLIILLAALGANGTVEALFSGIVTPLVVTPLTHRLKRR